MTNSIPWNQMPCSWCIKHKGKTEVTANRRSSNYYCDECNRDRQRDRYRQKQRVQMIHLPDLDQLGKALQEARKALESDVVDFTEVYTSVLSAGKAYGVLLKQVEDRVSEINVGRPRKEDGSKRTKINLLLQDLLTAFGIREEYGGQERVIASLRKELEALGYRGPEMAD